MQKNHENGQDDSDIAETGEPYTVKGAALNRYICCQQTITCSSKGQANQPRGQCLRHS